jgi:hypothetical protein
MLMAKTTGVHKKLLLSFTPSSLNFRLLAGKGNTLGSIPSPTNTDHYLHYNRVT